MGTIVCTFQSTEKAFGKCFLGAMAKRIQALKQRAVSLTFIKIPLRNDFLHSLKEIVTHPTLKKAVQEIVK